MDRGLATSQGCLQKLFCIIANASLYLLSTVEAQSNVSLALATLWKLQLVNGLSQGQRALSLPRGCNKAFCDHTTRAELTLFWASPVD
jgi:hypothetical protein